VTSRQSTVAIPCTYFVPTCLSAEQGQASVLREESQLGNALDLFRPEEVQVFQPFVTAYGACLVFQQGIVSPQDSQVETLSGWSQWSQCVSQGLEYRLGNEG